jgi:hypothetical protein
MVHLIPVTELTTQQNLDNDHRSLKNKSKEQKMCVTKFTQEGHTQEFFPVNKLYCRPIQLGGFDGRNLSGMA